jgi:hypothetical protein
MYKMLNTATGQAATSATVGEMDAFLTDIGSGLDAFESYSSTLGEVSLRSCRSFVLIRVSPDGLDVSYWKEFGTTVIKNLDSLITPLGTLLQVG